MKTCFECRHFCLIPKVPTDPEFESGGDAQLGCWLPAHWLANDKDTAAQHTENLLRANTCSEFLPG